jgi:hypothetical protein
VERHQRGLEQQADRDHRQADVEQHDIVRRLAHGPVDLCELDAARVPVDHRDAEQEERRRERAEQEVLDRGLLREQPAPAGQRAEQVQRQREDLQRDEHRQQIVR